MSIGAAAVEVPAEITDAPVLVIHGAAVRDRDAFELEVARLAEAVGSTRRFVPVFWGDLARPAESIDEVLPYLTWLNPPDDASKLGAVASELEALVLSAVPAGDESDGAPTRRRRRILAQGDVERLIDRVAANWRRQSAAARRRLISSVYRAVRAQYLTASAHFAGDIILYQRRHREIQSRVWETIMREAPGYGLQERPITVVTHSLGGSVAFDAAVAGTPRLHVDHLLTCACTVPYFHVIGCSPNTITPHTPGVASSLPPTIGLWTNFWLPLDPWGYLAAPVFQLSDGSSPADIEVHSGEREDRIMRHAASNYWRHPTVIKRLRAALDEPQA
ncbi:MAG: hypothetical protein AB7Q42_16840 [Acidimicrobiia bacterium]